MAPSKYASYLFCFLWPSEKQSDTVNDNLLIELSFALCVCTLYNLFYGEKGNHLIYTELPEKCSKQ